MVPHTTRLPVSDLLADRRLAQVVVELSSSVAGRGSDHAHQVAAERVGGVVTTTQNHEERSA